jgi:hypothetical protein
MTELEIIVRLLDQRELQPTIGGSNSSRKSGLKLPPITQKEPDGVTTVLLKGVVDAYSYTKFEEALNNLIDHEDYSGLLERSEL